MVMNSFLKIHVFLFFIIMIDRIVYKTRQTSINTGLHVAL